MRHLPCPLRKSQRKDLSLWCFVGFEKAFGGRIGLKFKIRLKRPHWDNKQRLENSFAKVAELYKNQSSDDMTVLGRR